MAYTFYQTDKVFEVRVQRRKEGFTLLRIMANLQIFDYGLV